MRPATGAIVVCFALLSGSAAGGYPQSNEDSGDAVSDRVDRYIRASMGRQHIPGLSLAVIRDGKMIKAKGYFPHDTSPEDFVRSVAKEPLNFRPGARWAYSNTGYVLLGMIVRDVSGCQSGCVLQNRDEVQHTFGFDLLDEGGADHRSRRDYSRGALLKV